MKFRTFDSISKLSLTVVNCFTGIDHSKLASRCSASECSLLYKYESHAVFFANYKPVIGWVPSIHLIRLHLDSINKIFVQLQLVNAWNVLSYRYSDYYNINILGRESFRFPRANCGIACAVSNWIRLRLLRERKCFAMISEPSDIMRKEYKRRDFLPLHRIQPIDRFSFRRGFI